MCISTNNKSGPQNLVAMRNKAGAPAPAATGNEFGPNALNLMGGLLYKSLQLMAQYDMKMQDNQLEYFKEQAQAQSKLVTDYLSTANASAEEGEKALIWAGGASIASGGVCLAAGGDGG